MILRLFTLIGVVAVAGSLYLILPQGAGPDAFQAVPEESSLAAYVAEGLFPDPDSLSENERLGHAVFEKPAEDEERIAEARAAMSAMPGMSGMQMSGDGTMPMGGDGTMQMSGDGAMPMGGDGTMPMSGNGAMPMGGDGTMPMGGETMPMGGDGTMQMGGDGTMQMGGDGTMPMGSDGPMPMADDETMQMGGDGTMQMGGDGTMPMGDGTMPMGGDGTMQMSGGETMQMGGDGTMPMGGDGTMPMAGGATMQMGGDGTMTMADGETMPMTGGSAEAQMGAGMTQEAAHEEDEESMGGDGLRILAAGAEVDREVEITMREWGYSVSDLEVQPGERIRLTIRNDGEIPHEFMFMPMVNMQAIRYRLERADWNLLEHEAPYERSLVMPGQSFQVAIRIEAPGVWMFMCMFPYHMQFGLMGQMATPGMSMEM